MFLKKTGLGWNRAGIGQTRLKLAKIGWNRLE